MNILNNKMKKFFIPLLIFLFIGYLILSDDITTYLIVYGAIDGFSWTIIYLILFFVTLLLFSVFILYPGIKILLKGYGSFLQRISIVIILMSSFMACIIMSDWNWFGELLIIFYMGFYLNYSSDVSSGNKSIFVSTSKNNILVSFIVIFLFIFSCFYVTYSGFNNYSLLVYLATQSIAIFSTVYLIISGIDKRYINT
ncbi:MAG: hypothetical protein LBU40_04150 [Methanobrevibacter sp.]|jgi:hypothetical protein|nr:hypothetical protein [Methanobrevibacter sp.]